MKKLLLMVILALSGLAFSSATDVYIAQSAAGLNDGSSCANAHAYSFFNTAGNWGAGATQIGSGTTVHLCGTVTTFNGATYDYLTFNGSGSSGSPITLKWETGAKLSVPSCGSAACISVNNKSWLTIDGGTNGVLEATDNGTGLGHQDPGNAIWDSNLGCQNCEFKNLTIQNIYVHTSVSDINLSGSPIGDGIHIGGSGILIHDITCHDAHWCFDWGTGSSATIQMYNLTAYNTDHCFAMGATGGSVSSALIHDNVCHDPAKWDTTANQYHHDGVHVFGAEPMSGIQIYNNYFYGNWGTNVTSMIFTQQATFTNLQIFNNVMILNSGAIMNNGIWNVSGASGSTGTSILNNTVIGGGSTSTGNCGGTDTQTSLTIQNNIFSGCKDLLVLSGDTFVAGGLDYNLYGPGGDWKNVSTFYTTFASWQAAVGEGAHSISNSDPTTNASVGVDSNSSGNLLPASPAIAMGKNLVALGISGLNSDRNAVPRTQSGAWDAGAYNFRTFAPARGLF